MHARSETTRIAAIRELLDRAYGRPTQFLATDSDATPENLSADELRAEIIAQVQQALPEYRLLKVVPPPIESRRRRQQTLTNRPPPALIETSTAPKPRLKNSLTLLALAASDSDAS
jgi:hypothetical protein